MSLFVDQHSQHRYSCQIFGITINDAYNHITFYKCIIMKHCTNHFCLTYGRKGPLRTRPKYRTIGLPEFFFCSKSLHRWRLSKLFFKITTILNVLAHPTLIKRLLEYNLICTCFSDILEKKMFKHVKKARLGCEYFARMWQ